MLEAERDEEAEEGNRVDEEGRFKLCGAAMQVDRVTTRAAAVAAVDLPPAIAPTLPNVFRNMVMCCVYYYCLTSSPQLWCRVY